MKRVDAFLRQTQGDFWYFGKSALDRYENNSPLVVSVATTAGLGELAASFEGLFFPGLEGADAAVTVEGVTLLFTIVDSSGAIPRFSPAPFNMIYSPSERKYVDREGEYDLMRRGLVEGEPLSYRDWSHFVRRMAWCDREDSFSFDDISSLFSRENDRFFLEDVITGPRADKALEYLFSSRWIETFFPSLAALADVEQNKEFHPEGNVWEHTLETLKYRKERPANLSLALLFHDLGKSQAEEVGQNRFHGHAQIGARQLTSLLDEWDFPDKLMNETVYLVANHMMPAAIERLPYHKKKEVIEDPLFPVLLELYRCDLSSSFNGLDGYYDACRYYKAFRKNVQNPYRKNDGTLKRGAV